MCVCICVCVYDTAAGVTFVTLTHVCLRPHRDYEENAEKKTETTYSYSECCAVAPPRVSRTSLSLCFLQTPSGGQRSSAAGTSIRRSVT